MFGDAPEKTLFLDALSGRSRNITERHRPGAGPAAATSNLLGEGGNNQILSLGRPSNEAALTDREEFQDGGTGLETIKCISTDFLWNPPGADPAVLFQILESKPGANEKPAGSAQPAAADRK